jgi:hypothetical protein
LLGQFLFEGRDFAAVLFELVEGIFSHGGNRP